MDWYTNSDGHPLNFFFGGGTPTTPTMAAPLLAFTFRLRFSKAMHPKNSVALRSCGRDQSVTSTTSVINSDPSSSIVHSSFGRKTRQNSS